MTFRTKIIQIENLLSDFKASNITPILIDDFNYETRAMVIATGNSHVQTKSIASRLKVAAKKNKLGYLGIEGLELGEWILLDLDDVIVHIMLEKTRSFYQLEKLWG